MRLSNELVTYRRTRLPRPALTAELPILDRRDAIVRALADHQVLIVAGATGSGKSTQLPQLCLSAGYGVQGMIGHTQPRRIAARTIANRIAAELGVVVGQEVGFKVRFHDQTSDHTFVKLMTDGILLAETQGDRLLHQYEVIIVDEAHERSLNVDFLLGYLHDVLSRRPEFRLIVTSATIDAERFAEYFQDAGFPAPLIEISGRTYPVEIRYRDPLGTNVERLVASCSSPPSTSQSSQEGSSNVERLVPSRSSPQRSYGRALNAGEWDLSDSIVDAIRELSCEPHGGILVFLPTERDIREVARRLRGERLLRGSGETPEILPLYARLSSGEQMRVFAPSPSWRIVLATNVAESSLTVPDIRYVVDTGTARMSRYSPRLKVQRLPIEAISRASADQRAGRCGRVAPGICLRLYSEEDYAARPEFTTPEIQRTNLASVILQSKALQLGEVETFPFLDPPRKDTIQDGYRTLFELGAIDEQRELTRLGREMARLPVDPRLARMILSAQDQGCLPEILVLAAALELQDPRERPADQQQRADECHQRFLDDHSDFVSLLKLWDFYHELKGKLTRNALRKACQQNFLSFNRMREWTETHRQLMELIQALARQDRSGRRGQQRTRRSESTSGTELLGRPDRKRYATIHKALLTGFLSGVAMRKTPVEYLGGGGIAFYLWPGSGLFERRPAWCLVAEMVETTRRFGRIVAEIQPEWIEPLAGHLIKRSYHDPHWHFRRGEAMAFERLMLFGLPIVPRRRVAYGSLDPATARELFLHDGLHHDHPFLSHVDVSRLDEEVQDQGSTKRPRRRESENAARQFINHDHSRTQKTLRRTDALACEPFFRHNQQLLEKAARIAARSRRADAMIDDFAIYRFYGGRIPEEISDLKGLRQWIGSDPRQHLSLLKMQLHDFVSIAAEDEAVQFPDRMAIERMELPLDYCFAPGDQHDGVTVVVPREGLRQLVGGRTEWLVPGLLAEKIEALIRSLPKKLRTNFIPVPDVARKLAAEIPFGQGDFFSQLVARLNAVSTDKIQESDFDVERLPKHLRMNIRVVDAVGAVLAEGRDLAQLSSRLDLHVEAEVPADSDATWHRDGITQWDFGDVPREISLVRGGISVTLYPTIVDAGDSVRLRIYDRSLDARRSLRAGVRRLLALQHRKLVRSQLSWLPGWSEWSLLASGLMTADRLRHEIGDLLVDRAFLGDGPLPHSQTEFEAMGKSAAERLALATQDVSRLMPKLFQAYHEARQEWEKKPSTIPKEVMVDVHQQVEALLIDRFLIDTPWEWLVEYPRYLRAITARLQKQSSRLTTRDAEAIEQLHKYWEQFLDRQQRYETNGVENPELLSFRWMIEEYRVSLFAQTLGTRISVSPTRLDRQLAKSG